MGPIDYMSQYPQFDLAQKFTSGLQAGAAVGQLDQQQAAQQAAQQQAQQYKTDVAAAMANPTPQNFSALALKYPAQREAIKQSWDGLSAGDQKAEGDTMAQAYAALLAGDVDAAKKVVQDQIAARKNSGLDTSHYDNALGLLNADPKQAQGALGFALSHISDPKTFAQSFGTLQELPGKVADGEAGAAGKQADNAAKNNALVGQTLGSLQGKGAKPAQAVTAIKSLQARGALSPADAQSMIDSVPTDPKALDDWFGQQRAAGMKPDDQQKYLTPDANTVATNQRIAAEGAANRAKDIQVQRMIDARQGGDDETQFIKELKKLYPAGSPEYQEALRQRINKEAGINAGGGGGRSVVYNGRIIASGNEVAQALRNITDLPVESNAGFMGMGQPKSAGLLSAGMTGLKNKLNDDQVKTYNTMWTGVSRNLGTLETSGLATTGDLIKSIDKLQFVPGDNGYNALRKLAEVRQITEAALDPKLADPAVPPDQKKYIQGVIDAVHQAVPYTHSDLTRFANQQKANPELTFQQFAAETVNKGKPAAAPSATPVAPTLPSGWSVEVH
jgi:hypothetical protein